MIKTAFIIYLTVLALSPLLFGTVHTFAYTFVFVGILGASLLLLKNNIIVAKDLPGGSSSYQFRLPKTAINLLYLFFIVFLIFQMIPLPDSILLKLSPEAKVVKGMSLPPFGASLTGDGISPAPYLYPVRMSLIRWIIYGLLFLGLAQTMVSRRRIEAAIILIIITGCFEALYGILQTYSGESHIWWFKSLSGPRDVSGTYINRNHFAGFMEMGIILTVAYAGALSKREPGRKGGLKVKVLRYLSGEEIRRFLIIFAGVVMALGLILSASRGGIVSTGGGLLLMGLFFAFRKDQRRKGFIILLLFFLTSLYALHIGIDYTLGRFQFLDRDFEFRMRYARKTMDLFADYPLCGVGMGNFQYAYPKYQALEDKGDFVEYAHNDWAQFLAETGVGGLLLLLAGMGYYLFRTLRLWRKRRDPFAACLGIVPIVALFTMAIHSFFDFNLHIPANFMIIAAVVAIGTAALYLQRQHDGEETRLPYHVFSLRGAGVPVALMYLALIFVTGTWTLRHFMAEVHCNTIITSPLNLNQHPPVEEIRKAISWDRRNAAYHYNIATALMNVRDQQTLISLQGQEIWYLLNRPIIAALERAILLNPLNAEYHTRLGWEYSYLSRQPDYVSRWLPAADVSMERAAYLGGNWVHNPHLHVDLGNYWIMRSKTFEPTDPRRQEAWVKAIWHYHKAQKLDDSTSIREEITRYVRNFYGDLNRIRYNP